jgi:hypothetical protein
MGVGGQSHAPADLPPGMTRYPLYRRLAPGPVWKGAKNLAPTRIRSPTNCYLKDNSSALGSEYQISAPEKRNVRCWLPHGLTCRFCGRSLAGIVCSNPAGGKDVCLLWMLCVVQLQTSATGRSLVQGSPGKCVYVIQCIRRNNNPLHLQWVGRRG